MTLALVLRVVALVALMLWLADLVRRPERSGWWRAQIVLAVLAIAGVIVLIATTPGEAAAF